MSENNSSQQNETTGKRPNPLLRKSYTERQFEKRIVGGLYLPQDREFLRRCFAVDEHGAYRLRSDLEAASLKRANALAKQIRKNRGSLKTGRVITLLLLVAAIILFNLLFKNSLLTRVGENALESVFEARAEIHGLDLRLLDGTLRLESVSVADRDRPLRNLFEIGPSVIDINLFELLKGNFVAHTLSVRNIRWNTERAESGALPGVAPQRTEQPAEETIGLAGFALMSLQPEDAEAFLMQHYEQLSVPQLTSDARQQLETAAENLSTRFDTTATRLDDLSGTVRRLETFRPREIDDLETALTTLREVQQLSREVTATIDAAEADLTAVRDDAAAAVALGDAFATALSADMSYLADRITDVTDDPTGFVMNIVEALLQERFGDLFHYLDRARELQALLDSGDPSERRAPYRPGGIDVSYPGVSWPRFYLGLTQVSFGSEESGSFHEGLLRSVSSAPQLTGRPTELHVQTVAGTRRHAVDASLALHRRGGPLMRLEYGAAGLPVATRADWGQVRLRELAGPADVQTSMLLERDWTVRGAAEITIRDPSLVLETGVAALDRILAEAAADAEDIGATFEYTARDNRISSLRGSTTLDRHIAAGVRSYMDQQRAAFEAELRRELNTVAARGRETLEPLETRLTDLADAARAELTRAEGYRREAEASLAAIESRVAELRAAAERRAREEIEREVESLIDRVPVPGIDTERLPRFR